MNHSDTNMRRRRTPSVLLLAARAFRDPDIVDGAGPDEDALHVVGGTALQRIARVLSGARWS